MKVQVHVPGPLLAYADGQGNVSVEFPGATVGDALAALWALHPRLRDRILDEQGRVRPHVNLFVDRESIRYTGGLATPLHAGSTLSVVPAVSGGAAAPETNPLPKHVSRLSAALDQDGDRDVVRDIEPTDPMYSYAPDLYFGAGQSALRCIRLAMLAADLQRVNRILDFGCAVGRVLRSLRAGFPEASITACEIRKHDVEWCQKTFGETHVIGVQCAREPDQVRLDGNFDVIWAGSILTHIEQRRWTGFIKLFESNLAPGGVVVFTVYGSYIAELVRSGKSLLNLTPERAAQVIRDYDATGFGFHVTRDDGDTIVSRSWVCQQLESAPSLELVGFAERAWMWQDVVACSKTRDQD